VKAEKGKATLLIKGSAVKDGVALNRDVVAARLGSLKVTSGVDWKAIDDAIASGLYDKTVVVARDIPPGESRDARIEELIKIDADVKPVVAEDGHADYRNVDNIHQVKQGDVLAVKHPAVQGEPGTDIFGKAIPAPLAKDASFKPGANTEVSPDGLQLLARTGGFVFHNAGAISVGITYTVKGDVGFKTGNLHYQGDIVVEGGVGDGFTVEAHGDVTILGNVDAAVVISHGGSVTVHQAVFGHGRGRIRAARDIRLQSAQDVSLECGGELRVEKALINCDAVAESVRADAAGCTVMGGTVKAYSEVHLAVLGGEGCRTEIRIADREAEAARVRMREIDKDLKAAEPKVEALEKKLKAMKILAQRAGGSMSPRAIGELKAALDAYAAMRKHVEGLEAARAEAAQATNSAVRHTGRCVIREKVVWGGCLEMYGHPRELDAGAADKEWVWTLEGLAARTILPEPAPGDPSPPRSPEGAPPS
jgi:uncharacterized protein (DUF342 family)